MKMNRFASTYVFETKEIDSRLSLSPSFPVVVIISLFIKLFIICCQSVEREPIYSQDNGGQFGQPRVSVAAYGKCLCCGVDGSRFQTLIVDGNECLFAHRIAGF